MSVQWYTYPVSHGYITSNQGPGTDTPHYALDIATPFHTPITAIESGTVVTADYQPWGGEIFIKPDNGSTEYYYYHPDELEVTAGQHVTAGQEVALSGGENPGYPGALHPTSTQYSTGPHTHVGFFTSWAQGPNGTMPFGPDITSTIQALNTTGIVSVPGQPGQPGIPPINTPPGVSGAMSIASVPGAVQSGLLRTGLFVIALMVIAGGGYIAFHNQINSAAKTAVKAVVL